MNLAEIYSELERVYSAINKKYYDDKLPLAIITIQSKKVVSGDAYGWASKNRWIDINGKRYYELNITAEYLNLDKYDIISTLAHEMRWCIFIVGKMILKILLGAIAITINGLKQKPKKEI